MPVDSPKAEHLIPTGSHETQDCPCPTLQHPSLTVRRRLLDDFMVDWEIIPARPARVVRHYIANLPVTIGTSGTAGTGCWMTHPGGPLSR